MVTINNTSDIIMAHFPQHSPALWEFTRGESDGHRKRRQAVDRSKADSELSRQKGTGVWWDDQRYVNQTLPSQFTDPKTFDNFNYGYQMYARQPIQRPIQSQTEASDAVPPLRYNVRRVAIDRPFKNAICAMRCCTKNFHSGNSHTITSNRIELPPIDRNVKKHNGCTIKSSCHAIKPMQHFAETSSSVCSTSVAESMSNLVFDYINNNNNNNNNNNTNNSYINNYGYNNNNNNYTNLNTNNNSSFINPADLSCTCLNFIGSGTIQNVFYPCVGLFCLNGDAETKSPHSFDKVKAFPENDFRTTLTSAKSKNTGHFRKKNAVVLKACPLYAQNYSTKPISNCLAQQQTVSSFVCKPSDPTINFPSNKLVEGRRTDMSIEENDRDVVCQRIQRTNTSNTPENVHLDSIDPLIVCLVKSKHPGYKPKPGYGTYKIIGGRQYREPPQENVIDSMVLPPHLHKFREYQRRCPDVRRGRYDKSNGLYEMLLPSSVCSTVLYADLNPFRYARNTNRNNEPPPVANHSDYYSCDGINTI